MSRVSRLGCLVTAGFSGSTTVGQHSTRRGITHACLLAFLSRFSCFASFLSVHKRRTLATFVRNRAVRCDASQADNVGTLFNGHCRPRQGMISGSQAPRAIFGEVNKIHDRDRNNLIMRSISLKQQFLEGAVQRFL